jgi:hypothetical protein
VINGRVGFQVEGKTLGRGGRRMAKFIHQGANKIFYTYLLPSFLLENKGKKSFKLLSFNI